MSMSTRRAKLSNVIMPEEPAKLQPCQKIVDEKEHLPEDDNEEWEEVLVGSYIPLPVIWDEHPTAQKLEKLIEKMEFQVHQEPVPNLNNIIATVSLNTNHLAIMPNGVFGQMEVLDMTRTRTGYEKSAEPLALWNDTKFIQGQRKAVAAPSGKFVALFINGFNLPSCTVWRLDFGQTNPVKLLEATPQEPMIPGNFSSSLASVSWFWTSDSYAYFATRDIIFRIDVYTGELKLVLLAEVQHMDGFIRHLDQIYDTKAVQMRKGLVVLMNKKESNRYIRLRF